MHVSQFLSATTYLLEYTGNDLNLIGRYENRIGLLFLRQENSMQINKKKET